MKINQRIMRFGIKKLSIGVVSVAVGFAFLAPTGISANEGSPVVKNESPLVVNATDNPIKKVLIKNRKYLLQMRKLQLLNQL